MKPGFFRLLACHLLAVAGLLLGAGGAHALDIYRNGTKYQIDVPLPGGARFTASGVDRRANVNGISINLRLIQDKYPDCKALVRERMISVARKGYSYDDESAVLTRSECQLHQWKDKGDEHIVSHYIWMEICGCYAAVHFSYPYKLEERYQKVSAPIAVAIRRGSSAKARETFREDGLDGEWLEAIKIFRKRGFSASQVHGFLRDSAHISLGPRDLLDRYAKLLADLYGTSVKKVRDGPEATAVWAYDVQTGYPLHAAGPVEFARNISTCYQSSKFWKTCELNYHQELGCRMTRSWQIVCRAYLDPGTDGMIGDLCFWEPRGDLPVLVGGGYKNEKSVMLPGAVKTKKTSKKKIAQSNVPYCKDEGAFSWREFMETSQRSGYSIPRGLKM